MLKSIGGFGRFQIIATTTMVISIAMGFNYFFPISFLEVQPQFDCLNTTINGVFDAGYQPCNSTDFCGTDIAY